MLPSISARYPFDGPITPPWRGSRRSRADRRRLMRWGGCQRFVHPLQHTKTVLKHFTVPKAQYPPGIDRCGLAPLPCRLLRSGAGGWGFSARFRPAPPPRESLNARRAEASVSTPGAIRGKAAPAASERRPSFSAFFLGDQEKGLAEGMGRAGRACAPGAGTTPAVTTPTPHRRACGLTPLACRLPLKGGVMRAALAQTAACLPACPADAGRRSPTAGKIIQSEAFFYPPHRVSPLPPQTRSSLDKTTSVSYIGQRLDRRCHSHEEPSG